VVLHDLRSEVFLKDDRAVLRATAYARTGAVTVDLDANIRDAALVHGTLRANALEPAFVRDIVRTLGVTVVVPDDALGAIDLALAPKDMRQSISGVVTLSTSTSKLVLDVTPGFPMRIGGRVSARDIIAMEVLGGTVAPVEGEIDVALDVLSAACGTVLRGTAFTSRLVLALRHRPEVPPYVLEEVNVVVSLEPDAFVYDRLRFRAHGARFVAKGRIPLTPDAVSDLVDLELEEGGAELAEALARLGNRPGGVRFRIAREGAREAREVWLPRVLTGRGRLLLRSDLSLRADVRVETPIGTALALGLLLSKDGHLDGSTLTGDIAMADAITSGYLGPAAAEHVNASNVVTIDLLVPPRTESAASALVSLQSDLLTMTLAKAQLVTTNLYAALRIDADGVAWNHAEVRTCSGMVTSSGIYRTSERRSLARVSLSQLAVHELPAISGREPGAFVRGQLSGTVIGGQSDRTRVAGDLVLEDAALPALDLLRPTLARYGLRPPNEDAVGPVTATVIGDDWGLSLRDVKVDLRGATVRGAVGLSRDRVLEADTEVTLEEEYLRTSKLLTLPRVLTERLVLPVRIEGPLAQPRVHANLGVSLGRFLKDNRVSAFVTSAVEEAQFLLGRHPIRAPTRASERPPHEADLDTTLRAKLDEHAADWELIARRRAARDFTGSSKDLKER
jgi:hypothetical protein